MQAVLQQVHPVAPTDSAVLILGETGTGKELIARAIHDRSSRKDQAFIKVDCAAIPPSLSRSFRLPHASPIKQCLHLASFLLVQGGLQDYASISA